ncbi:MAG: cyanophycin synthetase [Ferruginibacter sp.]
MQSKENTINTTVWQQVSRQRQWIYRKEKIREALQTFESLEHRMEPVATIRGVQFINDSKATNVNSTWFALESMEKPVILILGRGVDKGNDYSLLKELVERKSKSNCLFGQRQCKDSRSIW